MSTTSSRRSASVACCGRGSALRRWASSCSAPPGPGHRRVRGSRLPRVPRPEAARHPDDGAPRPRHRALGADYLTLHAQGGVPAARRRRRARRGCRARGPAPATALAVTILTSDGDAPEHILPKRRRGRREWLRWHRVRRDRRARRRALRRVSRSSCPASVRRRCPPRPGSCATPARRSMPVPTCS